MAELGLAVAGLLLAWKGVADFAHFVNELTEDDRRQRVVLGRRFRISKAMLEEWMDYWGVDQQSGRFYTLKPDRQQVIKELIEQLQATTMEATKILGGKYDSVGVVAEGLPNNPKRGFAKYSAKVTTAVKRGGDKAQWMVVHQAVIEKLIEDTETVWRDLNGIASATDDLMRIVATNTSRLRSRMTLVTAVDQVMESVRTRRNVAVSYEELSDGVSDEYIDQSTLAGLATRTLPSSRQADLVQRHLEAAFDCLGDTRVVEHVAEWWNDSRSNIMLLEASDEPIDQTSISGCVLLYLHVDCQKLLYVFEDDSGLSPAQQILDMVRTLCQSLFISRKSDQPLSQDAQASIQLLLDDDAMRNAALLQLIPMVVQLLQETLASSDKRVVLILAGLEIFELAEPDESTVFVQAFLRGLDKLCTRGVDSASASFKALFSCKGYASALYDSGEYIDTVDLTDYSPRVTSLGEKMASCLNG